MQFLTADSGWDEVTAIHSAADGLFVAADRSYCSVLPSLPSVHNRC